MTAPIIQRLTVTDQQINLGQLPANTLIMNIGAADNVYVSPNTNVSPASGAPIVPNSSLIWSQNVTCWIVADTGASVQVVVSNAITNPKAPPAVIPPSLNDITFSLVAPSGTGNANALWFQLDNNTDRNVIGQWYWNGTAWVSWPLSNQVIANLDAGKINTGTLNGITITGNTITGNTIEGGSINGSTIEGATVTGSVFQTSDTGTSVTVSNTAANGSPGIGFYDSTYGTTGFIRMSSGSVNITSPQSFGEGVIALSGSGFSVTVDGQTVISMSNPSNSSIYSPEGLTISSGGNVVISANNITLSGTVSLGTLNGITVAGSANLDGTLWGNNPGIYGVGLTGVANLQCGASNTSYRIGTISSLSKYKLDQQEIPLDYTVLDMVGKTWVGKFEHDLDSNYSTRTPGFVAEDVEALSQSHGDALKELLIYDENGLQAIAYDRIVAYLIPVIRDMESRIRTLESQLHN